MENWLILRGLISVFHAPEKPRPRRQTLRKNETPTGVSSVVQI